MYMKQVCKFDSTRDIQKTIPSLFTSIRLALDSGVVMDTGIDVQSNDIDDPSNIWGRIDDVFSALDAQKRALNSRNTEHVSNDVTSQPVTGESE